MKDDLKIAIIGGGAAGFFSALSVKDHYPNSSVTIFEKSNKLLSKVKISGGGRCNVTNATYDIKELSMNYPRGGNFLKKAFGQFNTIDTVEWFENRGVLLETLNDNCIFPKSNTSQSIIDCFINQAKIKGVEILLKTGVEKIRNDEDTFILYSQENKFKFDKVIVTTGGQPKLSCLNWLANLGHDIVSPLPSLFTFNMPKNPICELMGNVVEETTVKIEGTKLVAKGPLLVTHWGMSGPAILKLSAWGARILEEKNYQFSILVNWLNDKKPEEAFQVIEKVINDNRDKKVINYNPFPMTNRLWGFILEKSSINLDTKWKEIGKKSINKLVNSLCNDRYEVSGKTTFKEEFVTAGGVSLKDVNVQRMESKVVPGLFFAGEVLDIDGITGGFNFQAAWTTAYIAGKYVGV
ncbi:NAD(P)/FAD-dependent oxidoreductase [Crocinitomicaceae bacterium]|nr:NAD(P)/FAD-dependent oxidoreductase [Crocinitomicaceae bacterium]